MQLDQMTADWKSAFQATLPEYVDFLFVNSDFATGRAQLGDYYMKRQSADKAILHYKKALEMDNQIIPVYGNLATAYSLLGHPDTALLVLGKWIEIEPESSRAYYLRGLLHFELNNLNDAEFNFEYAILKDPGFYRGYYNLATLLYYQERYTEAKVIISKGLEQSPGEEDGKDLLQLLEQQL
jgi:tetratricopeptide (TPR) repeat protein